MRWGNASNLLGMQIDNTGDTPLLFWLPGVPADAVLTLFVEAGDPAFRVVHALVGRRHAGCQQMVVVVSPQRGARSLPSLSPGRWFVANLPLIVVLAGVHPFLSEPLSCVLAGNPWLLRLARMLGLTVFASWKECLQTLYSLLCALA